MKKIVLLLFLAFPLTSYAYLDPGSISLFLQGLIAGVAGFFGFFALHWNKIKNFFKKLKKKD